MMSPVFRPLAYLSLVAVVVSAAACGSKDPDKTNTLPFGHMDAPAAGATVQRAASVAGWALDESAIARVNIYVDGRYVSFITPQTVPRPDVAKAFPGLPHNDLAGWQGIVDLGDLKGAHTILAQAVDDKGATADLGSAAVTIADAPK